MVLPAPDPPLIHLRIGTLDPASTRILRDLLHLSANEPGTHVVVDLRQMDDGHDMTLFALLAAKARSVTQVFGRMTAVHPTPRLAHLLAAVGVTVTREFPPAKLARVDVLQVGLLTD